jgi:hypothetical protein
MHVCEKHGVLEPEDCALSTAADASGPPVSAAHDRSAMTDPVGQMEQFVNTPKTVPTPHVPGGYASDRRESALHTSPPV